MFIALSSCSHVEDQPYLIVFLWTQDPLLSFNLVLVVTGIYFGTFFSHYLWLLTDGAVVIVDLDFFIISTCWPLNGSRRIKFWDILTRRSTARRDPLYYILTRRSTARRDPLYYILTRRSTARRDSRLYPYSPLNGSTGFYYLVVLSCCCSWMSGLIRSRMLHSSLRFVYL